MYSPLSLLPPVGGGGAPSCGWCDPSVLGTSSTNAKIISETSFACFSQQLQPSSLFPLCQEPVFASVYSSTTPQYIMCFNQVIVRAAAWQMDRSFYFFLAFAVFLYAVKVFFFFLPMMCEVSLVLTSRHLRSVSVCENDPFSGVKHRSSHFNRSHRVAALILVVFLHLCRLNFFPSWLIFDKLKQYLRIQFEKKGLFGQKLKIVKFLFLFGLSCLHEQIFPPFYVHRQSNVLMLQPHFVQSRSPTYL